MSLFDSIKPLIRVCQLSGLTPFSMNKTSIKWESNHSLKVLSIILIVFVGTILLSGLIFRESIIDYKRSKIRNALVITFMVLNHINAIFALLELFKKRDRQINLLNLFESLDFLFKNRLNMHINYLKLKTACHRFIIVWICEISGLIISNIIIYIQTKDNYTIAFFIMLIPHYVLCKLSYAYAVLLVTLVYEDFSVLNQYIKSVTKQNGYYVCETFLNKNDFKNSKMDHFKNSKFHVNPEMILFMKSVYCDIWEASKEIENLTYWSLPIGCAYDFFVLTSNSYLFFLNLFTRSRNFPIYLLLLLLILSSLGSMLLIAHSYSRTVESVSEQIKAIPKCCIFEVTPNIFVGICSSIKCTSYSNPFFRYTFESNGRLRISLNNIL